MNEEHYLTKISRNLNVLDKVSEEERPKYLNNIRWAKNLSDRLELLDYDNRQNAIAHIHEVMDADYKSMGFGKETNRIKR